MRVKKSTLGAIVKFAPIPDGTHVTWHYRGAIGHGTVKGVHKLGTSAATTEYSIAEHDHHVSDSGSKEKPTVYHYGSALTRVAKSEFAVLKASAEKRYVLGVVYQAGRAETIAKGVDGHRDFISPETLEEAAWGFIRKGAKTGVAHASWLGLPRQDVAEIVESYVYRGPDWHVTDINGRDTVVKAGDWLAGAILTPEAFAAVKQRRFDGWSPQGTGRRRTHRRDT